MIFLRTSEKTGKFQLLKLRLSDFTDYFCWVSYVIIFVIYNIWQLLKSPFYKMLTILAIHFLNHFY